MVSAVEPISNSMTYPKLTALSTITALSFIGCSSEVEVKVVDKPINSPYAERPIEPASLEPERVQVEMAQASEEISGMPHWDALSDWEQVPAPRMVNEKYTLPTGASLAISSLGGGGTDAANLARWARQLGITFSPEMLQSTAKPAPQDSLPFNRYALANDTRAFDIAVLRGGQSAWFFKLEGSPEQVSSSEAAFMTFLSGIHTHDEDNGAHGDSNYNSTDEKVDAYADEKPEATSASQIPPTLVSAPENKMQPMPGMAEQVASIDGATWTVPASWREGPANPMRKGTYLISNDGGNAELSITAFPGDVGGLEANVNRWRRQSGLPPLDGTAIRDSIEAIPVPAGEMIIVMIEGSAQSILGGILPQALETWFFKMTGPAAALKAEAETFEAFLKTVSF